MRLYLMINDKFVYCSWLAARPCSTGVAGVGAALGETPVGGEVSITGLINSPQANTTQLLITGASRWTSPGHPAALYCRVYVRSKCGTPCKPRIGWPARGAYRIDRKCGCKFKTALGSSDSPCRSTS